ncbi:MAG: hypothetical protein ACFFDW_15240 [Candidatus Thorarchaeota archaeon]
MSAKKTNNKPSNKSQKNSTKSMPSVNDIDVLKENLMTLSVELNKNAMELPSLVSTRGTKQNNMNGIIQDKFEIDIELIQMLEEFFERLVFLLNLRASYDQKLHRISKMISNLKDAKSIGEFKGNLQLLGITLNELEQIVSEYQEMYTNLFTEQALLQFQLMEQLMMFRDKDIPNFKKMFQTSLDAFNNINEQLDNFKE